MVVSDDFLGEGATLLLQILKILMGKLLSVFSGLNWWRVGAGVVLGIAIIFAARYVWIGRPQEFYDRGVETGASAEKARCESQERKRNEEVFKRREAEHKRRESILSAPDLPASRLLERMRLGDL